MLTVAGNNITVLSQKMAALDFPEDLESYTKVRYGMFALSYFTRFNFF